MYVEIYSDIVCPWCYIGERRFRRALDALPNGKNIEVVFRPFQLDPSTPETPQPLKQYLSKKFGAQVDAVTKQTASVAAGEGLDLRFDKAQSVNTLTAHRLLRFALKRGGPETQHALADKLFEAHFTAGANVADPELLADLAADAGLPREEVLLYLQSDEGIAEIQEEISRAQRLGIRAVPTFVFNGESAVQGAQPTSTFLSVLEDMRATEAASEGASACVDGACAN